MWSRQSYKPHFETQPTSQIYIHPIYIDRANCAYEARKPRREPLRNSGTITRSLK